MLPGTSGPPGAPPPPPVPRPPHAPPPPSQPLPPPSSSRGPDAASVGAAQVGVASKFTSFAMLPPTAPSQPMSVEDAPTAGLSGELRSASQPEDPSRCSCRARTTPAAGLTSWWHDGRPRPPTCGHRSWKMLALRATSRSRTSASDHKPRQLIREGKRGCRRGTRTMESGAQRLYGCLCKA